MKWLAGRQKVQCSRARESEGEEQEEDEQRGRQELTLEFACCQLNQLGKLSVCVLGDICTLNYAYYAATLCIPPPFTLSN